MATGILPCFWQCRSLGTVAARVEPLHFYGAVERGIARRMGADRRYSGLITKNPVHPHWRVEWRREEPYTLPELADWLFPEDMQPDFSVETTLGVGRNCTVFDELRLIAYREVRAFKRNGSLDTFRARLERVAIGINMQFPEAASTGRGARDRQIGGEVDLAAFQQREILGVAEAPHQYPLGGSRLG